MKGKIASFACKEGSAVVAEYVNKVLIIGAVAFLQMSRKPLMKG